MTVAARVTVFGLRHYEANKYQLQFLPPYPGAAAFRLSGHIATAEMGCPEPLMQRAEAFVGALAAARGLRTQEDQLHLLDADAASQATLTAQSQKLPGTVWHVPACNNGTQAVANPGQ